MKTILFTIAIIGITASGSFAQNTKNCTCKKTAHHKVMHQKVAVGLKTTKAPLYSNRTHNTANEAPGAYPGNDVWGNGVVAPENGNSAVMNTSVAYSTESSYTGNYPKPTIQDTRVDPRENSGARPHVDVLCLYDCK